MARIASETEQAQCKEIGERLLDILLPFARSLLAPDHSEDDVIHVAAAFAVQTMAVALEGRTQTARVGMIAGIGEALGSMEGELQMVSSASLIPTLSKGIDAGLRSRLDAECPRGAA